MYWSTRKNYLLTRVLYFLSGNGFVFVGAKSLLEIEYNFGNNIKDH
jgi:hypothetical protein